LEMTLEERRAALLAQHEFYPNFVKADQTKANVPKGLVVGTVYPSRKALSEAGVHAHTYAGISGTKAGGGKSVVLSGGYKDDQDMGNVILYTGTGGQRNSFSQPGPQIEDQSFDHPMNGYLKKSFETQIPIRVIRGPSDSCFSPAQGYRYDGLYKVTECYLDKGKHGFAVCRFRLERLPGQPPIKKRSTW